MIDVQTEPELQPLTIPDARPSQVLRSIPRDRWAMRTFRHVGETVTMCAVGHLADHASMDWGMGWISDDGDWGATNSFLAVLRLVVDNWALTTHECREIIHLNDEDGPDAVIAYLESLGK